MKNVLKMLFKRNRVFIGNKKNVLGCVEIFLKEFLVII